MPKYQVLYLPSNLAERMGLETEVEADGHHVQGRFIVFSKGGEVILQVAAANVLQIKQIN